MKKSILRSCVSLAVVASFAAFAAPVFAQDESAASADEAAADDDIVVTGVAKGQNKLDTSVSVSSIGSEAIANASPRSVAELFRSLPGIRSESSGGEGNANIAVRGLPVASGGAKFLQLQEDGLPILEFGDIAFGNADIFLRSDFNVARVESVRGGSASTFASNSPGGIINLISKTGEVEGGSLQALIGVDYDEKRFDFDYGKSLGNDLFVHMGGFYRQGDGPRKIGYDGNKGGQIKLNITKKFNGGYVRLYGKYLDDRAVGYLPNPVKVTGTNANPKYENLPGFNINQDSLHSRYFTNAVTLDGENKRTNVDIRQGQRPIVAAIGFEGQIEVADGLTVTNRFRYADTKGGFVSPFPASVDTATNVAGIGNTLVYANGPSAGQVVPAATNVAQIVLFNTRLKSLNNITNDLRVNKEIIWDSGKANFTVGFYKSRQDINTEWLWSSHLLEVKGGGNGALIDIRNAAGALTTAGGTVAYGASFFGNCCRRIYDVTYDTNAPFASANGEFGKLTLDASIRLDYGKAKGRVFGADLGPTAAGVPRVGVVPTDINGNGVIAGPELLTSVVPLTQPALVNYNYDYVSYSLGANYRLSDTLAVFGRYSKGGRANADRILFNGNNTDQTTGRLLNKDVAIDFVKQAEAGIKYRSGGVQFYGTVFQAKTEEENFEATTQKVFSRAYKATGVELEAGYSIGGFSLSGTGTYTDAKITRDNITPATVGNRPRRQAKFIYQVTPQYSVDLFTIGANVIGTSSSYAQDSNQLKLPAFTQVNAFVSVRPVKNIQLSVNANNLFNVEGFTESEEGSIPANGIVRARSISGRTISAAIKYNF
jgi:outer membrane receptor protein involved in Fe transport